MKNVQLHLNGNLRSKQLRETKSLYGLLFFALLLFVTELPAKLFAQAPAITYAGPQTYYTNNTITPLTPTNTGGAVAAPAYSSNPVIIGTGYNQNRGVATDAAGNVYVTDFYNNAIKKIPKGGAQTVFISGLNGPSGIAIDGAGNIYVCISNSSTILEIPGGVGNPAATPVAIGTGFNGASGVAVDAAGNVYVADYLNNAVKEIVAGSGTTITLASSLGYPSAVSADAAGNVYVANTYSNNVLEIPIGVGLARGTTTTIGSGFNTPQGVSVDPQGNIYVADVGNDAIKEVPAGGGSPISLGSGYITPSSVCTDAAGNVYVGDPSTGTVKKIAPIGGYFLSAALPPGLSFNGITGSISGTPVGLNPAANYTITAYNSGGSSTASVNISVGPLPKPTLSYAGPKNYTLAKAVTPFAPTSANVGPPGYSTSLSTFNSGATNPYGVAVDAAGNIYVSDLASKTIKEIPVGGGSIITIGAGLLQNPEGVAVDAQGNVYTADYYFPAVREIVKSNGSAVSLGTGFNEIQGVAVDAAGNVYVADFGDDPSVKEILKSNGSTVSIGTGFSDYPSQIAVDAAGNVYVADNYAVKEIVKSTGATITLSTGFSTPKGVAVDASGNVYFSDSGNGAIQEILAGGGQFTIFSGLSNPGQIAVDGAGNVYFIDGSSSSVKVIKPNGGYYLSTALPSGLSFSQTTGTITGTPTAISPPTNYTITAYNTMGGTSASVNIAVSNGSTYTAPTIQASKVNFTNTSYTSSTANWTNGNGTSVAVFIAQTAYGSAAPVNGVTYTAGATFGSGTEIGATGWYCVYNGPADNVAVTGLTAGTTYRITAVSYNGTPGSEAYLNPANTSVAVRLSPASMTTLFTTPNEPARKVEFTNTTYTSTTASWTDGNGSARAVFILQGANGGPLPADGTAFTADASSYTAGTEVGTSGWYCVYNGTGSSVDISGLAIGTTYRVSVVEYNTISGVQKYLTTGQSPANVTTLMTVPTEPARKVEFSNTTNTSTTASWTNGNGSARAVFIINAPDGGAFPVNGTSYSASPTSGPGTEIGSTGWFCIYNGTGSSVNISGLYSGTIYRVAVVEYNTISGTEYYLTTGQSPANVTTTGPHTLNHVFGGDEPFPLISSLSDQKVEPNNILTPNGDGLNDTWQVKNITNYPNNRVTVYDRTGNIVYTKQGYANDWAGTYHGSVLNQGTYYYLVDLGNGSTLRGFITVVRDR